MTINDQEARSGRKGRARINRTVLALMDRGVDSHLAQSLQRAGWTLSKMKQTDEPTLLGLGIAPHVIHQIHSEERPPIPPQTAAQVLIANRFTCCVCHDTNRSVVIHHINPWAQSRDHKPANLAVICLEDHDRAHKTGGHTVNLSPEMLSKAKAAWEEKVTQFDARAILDATAADSDIWWYFNHDRLFKLAADLKVDLTGIQGYAACLAKGQIDKDGSLRPRNPNSYWMYAGGDGTWLARYVGRVLRAVLANVPILNASNDLDRGLLHDILKAGDFVFVQGGFNFKATAEGRGPGQNTVGTRHANNVEITFSLDRWEATANSPHSVWLSGRQEACAVLRVLSVERKDGKLQIGATSLAIGPPLEGMKTREYANAPYRRGYYVFADDEDEGFADADEEISWEDHPDNPANYENPPAPDSKQP